MNLRNNSTVDYLKLHLGTNSDNNNVNRSSSNSKQLTLDMSLESDPEKLDQELDLSHQQEDELEEEVENLSVKLRKLELEEKKMQMELLIRKRQESIAKMKRDTELELQAERQAEAQLSRLRSQSPPQRQQDTTSYNSLLQPPELQPLGGTMSGLLRVDTNPQVYLKPNNPQGKAYKKITDFISRNGQVEEEFQIGDGVSIKMGSSSNKRKLDQISPSQWIAANARIQAELIGEGMEMCGIHDYLSYTAKIGELATRFTWASVLHYDDEYRRNQSIMGFRWGSDSQHLTTVLLREREINSKPQNRRSQNNQRVNKDAQSNEPQSCGYYNYGKNCPYGDKCIFPHTCAVCGKNHKKIDHYKEGGDKRHEASEVRE